MTIHHYWATERDRGRSSLTPYVLVMGSLLLVLTLVVLTFPVRRYPRSLQSRNDAMTVSSAAMQYIIDQQTCPKGVDALSGGYLSPNTRLVDPWGTPFRLYCANTGSPADLVYACSDGPNQLHGDADDLCDLGMVHEPSLMWDSTLGAAAPPTRPAWAPRWASDEPEREKKSEGE